MRDQRLVKVVAWTAIVAMVLTVAISLVGVLR